MYAVMYAGSGPGHVHIFLKHMNIDIFSKLFRVLTRTRIGLQNGTNGTRGTYTNKISQICNTMYELQNSTALLGKVSTPGKRVEE